MSKVDAARKLTEAFKTILREKDSELYRDSMRYFLNGIRCMQELYGCRGCDSLVDPDESIEGFCLQCIEKKMYEKSATYRKLKDER